MVPPASLRFLTDASMGSSLAYISSTSSFSVDFGPVGPFKPRRFGAAADLPASFVEPTGLIADTAYDAFLWAKAVGRFKPDFYSGAAVIVFSGLDGVVSFEEAEVCAADLPFERSLFLFGVVASVLADCGGCFGAASLLRSGCLLAPGVAAVAGRVGDFGLSAALVFCTGTLGFAFVTGLFAVVAGAGLPRLIKSAGFIGPAESFFSFLAALIFVACM